MRANNKTNFMKNEEGFTLIEIIAVLVILGILAAVAIPKYLDMRTDAIRNAAMGAVAELNARERLALAQSKLSDSAANSKYTAPDTNLGVDWGNVAIVDGSVISFKGKNITFHKTTAAASVGDPTGINTPDQWSIGTIS